MKNFSKVVFSFFLCLIIIVGCNQSNNAKQGKETILKGKTTLLVDETIKPIIEDEVQIFESKYEATLQIISKSEGEVLQSLANNNAAIAILSRKLTDKEIQFFVQKKISPKTTPFAKDAIALITNKNNNDTIISLSEVATFLKGATNSKIKGLVFDNPNSSTAKAICELAGIISLPEKGVFSFKTNEEVIRYVAKNDGMIGIVGINYIFQPLPEMSKYVDAIHVLNLKNTQDNSYYSPSQNNIAEGKYPLVRNLYLINCQGFSGLGMGFASFIAGETGQRIVLKSGLVPIRFPSRKIITRKKINNEKE